MRFFLVVVAVLITAAYIISPVDLVPDPLYIIGWVDDIALLFILLYFLETGRLPGFISRIFTKESGSETEQDFSSGHDQFAGGRDHRKAEDPHEVLGVSPGATKDEIRSAYRQMVAKYHPDKVSHLGPEFQALAKKRFIEIQNAYDALMKENGA